MIVFLTSKVIKKNITIFGDPPKPARQIWKLLSYMY